jgi:hypothetical protein
MENGYEPTRTPSAFTRFCSSVRYGAIEDSGRLGCERGGQLKKEYSSPEVVSRVNPRCEYLMSERPLRWGRERQERLQPIEHLLKQARYARKNAEFPFQPHDRLKQKKRGKGAKRARGKNSSSTILFDARRRRGKER